MFENTRTIIVRGPCGSGDGRECTHGFLAPYDCLRAFYWGGGGGDMHAQLSDTGCLQVYGVYTGWTKNVELRAGPHGMPYDHPRVTGILALTVPVKYPGAPCDLGITPVVCLLYSLLNQSGIMDKKQ